MSPTEVAMAFVDCINRGDLDGLERLMTEDHTLRDLDEAPLVGRAANVEAWRGYFESFPEYVIHPAAVTVDGSTVTIVGATTGSHLGLPDAEERAITVVWVAEVVDGRLSSWRVAEA